MIIVPVKVDPVFSPATGVAEKSIFKSIAEERSNIPEKELQEISLPFSIRVNSVE